MPPNLERGGSSHKQGWLRAGRVGQHHHAYPHANHANARRHLDGAVLPETIPALSLTGRAAVPGTRMFRSRGTGALVIGRPEERRHAGRRAAARWTRRHRIIPLSGARPQARRRAQQRRGLGPGPDVVDQRRSLALRDARPSRGRVVERVECSASRRRAHRQPPPHAVAPLELLRVVVLHRSRATWPRRIQRAPPGGPCPTRSLGRRRRHDGRSRRANHHHLDHGLR